MRARITRDVIDPARILEAADGPEAGAVVLFLGRVRDHNDGRPVRGMRYEAYVEMAEPVLARIAEEAAARLGSDDVIVVHRIGELEVGDISVAIAAAAAHRAEAFDAARYVIEEIKTRLPVWKHEHYTDGAAEWLAGAAPPEAAS